MRKLPVFKSAKEVYAGVFTHFFDLVRVAWLPLVIWLFVSAWANWWMMHHFMLNPTFGAATVGTISQGQPDAKAIQHAQAAAFMKMMPVIYGFMFLQYFVLSIIAIGFHRFVLLGERVHGLAGTGLAFGRNELLYIWSLIKIGLVGILALIPVMAVVAIVVAGISKGLGGAGPKGTSPALILIVAGAYLAAIVTWLLAASRLMLVLPHVALGNRSQLRFIWRNSDGNSWRLVGYFLLVALGVGIGSIIVVLPIYWLLGISIFSSAEVFHDMATNPWKFTLRFIVSIPLSLIWTMATITMLSVAYREIIGLPEGAAPESARPA